MPILYCENVAGKNIMSNRLECLSQKHNTNRKKWTLNGEKVKEFRRFTHGIYSHRGNRLHLGGEEVGKNRRNLHMIIIPGPTAVETCTKVLMFSSSLPSCAREWYGD